jgi:nitrogen fixation protein NifZ
MEKGAIGYIKHMGEFLQVIRVYEVHFFGSGKEVDIIGCREHELEAMEDFVDEIAEERAFMEAHRAKMQKLYGE